MDLITDIILDVVKEAAKEEVKFIDDLHPDIVIFGRKYKASEVLEKVDPRIYTLITMGARMMHLSEDGTRGDPTDPTGRKWLEAQLADSGVCLSKKELKQLRNAYDQAESYFAKERH